MRALIRALVAIAGVLLLWFAGCVWWTLFRPLPSDAKLERLFREHRAELDRLAAMAIDDTQLVGAGSYGVYVRDTSRFNRRLTEEELHSTGRIELLRLLDRAGLPAVSRPRDGVALWFVVVANAGGRRKGIVYSELPLEPIVSSLDSLQRLRSSTWQSAYVPLTPRWFLFLQPRD